MRIKKGHLFCLSLIGFLIQIEATDTTICMNCPSPYPCTTISFGSYETFIRNIPEDTPVGSVIGILDTYGTENEITLQPTSNDYLRLELPSRNITLQQQLDTDKGSSSLSLRIPCTPKDELSSTVTVTIRVLLVDVNDHAPTFSQDQYTVNISEDAVPGTTIFRDAKAHDDDKSGDGNDLFSYSILPGPFSDYFEYEYPLYPDITLKKKLDFEHTTYMEIEIMAKDTPVRGSSLNSTVKLRINVKDADDLNPKFVYDQYFGTVSGNSVPGTMVTVSPSAVSAYDQDTLNAAVKYELTDPKGKFTIDDQTGIVSVNGPLGSEANTRFILKAIQTDNPFRWCIATLAIDINGAAPPTTQNETLRFQFQRYNVTLSESTPVGTIVKSLHPTGQTKDRTLSYSIMENQNVFIIQSSGDIILGKALDYEHNQYYTITVTVTDGYDTAITTVNVYVADVNDNSPVIGTPTISLSAERVKGTVLTIIEVTDKDNNSQFIFQLLSHISLFAVDVIGQVSITGLPEELIEDKYILTISVKDNGAPVRESIALVIVNFPASSRPVAKAAIMTESSDILAIGLGVAAAVLFIIVIILIVYIIRRRLYAAEQLDRVKHQRGMNPRGLTYRPGDPSPVPSHFDLKFNGDLEETSEIDGSTTIQDNPLSDSRYRYGYPNLNGDVDLDAGDEEIHIDTAVVPFEREDYFRGSGRMKTFGGGHEECNSSDNSYASDSTGDSNKGLMKNLKKQALANGSDKIGNTNRIPSYMSDSVLESRLGQKSSKEKPEITVYF
ncbi:fat-like cadherin-related tumor suppressor homolog isoform X1 [Mytilus californianus]|uniref:fat-like cadherin-related tumor suppressor homolog isoform X1 n=1 Tax=Mytilus californianus TaxID=6549 RepID=UPI0022465D6F|nr:fat-like cadherin-related tumor suppressor homolog isoform X1 [Mytilus californianus]XP_052104528.1 fat-like cadherin-related tumor suppressor homolog isoform X1 [Mytilus californianus]XP_052104529.1 fat-like cadherin-related tumor suppressor homolog isoform X1 [Mytilus californianus]XP_052104530.1 fat-like cadherin-related tumor suppressor homolog isoform X1 [Mytilus californianus]